MIKVEQLQYNDFMVNTYVIYDSTGECVIIDPGCIGKAEEDHLSGFINSHNLKPVKLVNTHCHIDHIPGNRFVFEQYNLKPIIHKLELNNLQFADEYSSAFNFPPPNSPEPEEYFDEGDIIKFGNSSLNIIYTPGHSPGHITLYSKESKFMVCGDVLFAQSIGRTDLPGGNYDQLIKTIKEKLLVLGDDITVYPGHGPQTLTGYEKTNNPFLVN